MIQTWLSGSRCSKKEQSQYLTSTNSQDLSFSKFLIFSNQILNRKLFLEPGSIGKLQSGVYGSTKGVLKKLASDANVSRFIRESRRQLSLALQCLARWLEEHLTQTLNLPLWLLDCHFKMCNTVSNIGAMVVSDHKFKSYYNSSFPLDWHYRRRERSRP